jgi:hypothetical protein
MSRRISHRRIVAVAVVIVAGLGLGLGISRFWIGREAAPRLVPETPAPEASRPADRPQAADNDPDPAGPAAGRRALLVGVTTYDHLPPALHLKGPANDVRLVRRLLQERYRFPAAGIVSLTEDEGSPAQRPTRANIEREFRRLADRAREGDQVVILLSGHGSRQPEADPPSSEHPEPDGLDEIFLPADVKAWNNSSGRVPNAVVDDEFGAWLRAITAKKAYVWVIFDCCHSGTMTRGTEVVREVPPEVLVPREELDRAHERASRRRETTRGGPAAQPAPFVPRQPSDYLVATYACRSHESTPEGLLPPGSPDSKSHGLLTYCLVDILIKSAESRAALTYRELVRRLQALYAGRLQGAPTPLVEGRGQDRIVLGTEQPTRSRLMLTRDRDGYKVDAGDLYGLTPGSILAVDSPGGTEGEPKLQGHVKVRATRPFDSTVEPCAYEGFELVRNLIPLSACRPVFIDYGLRRFKVAIQAPDGQTTPRERLRAAVQPLTDAKGGLAELVKDPHQADWLVRLVQGEVELVEASGNRPAFPLPPPDNPALADALRRDLEKAYRARNLVALASRFEGERYRGSPAVDVEVEVLRQKDLSAPGEALAAPDGGWVFRPGDFISFRIHNKSPSIRVDVTLLIVGSDFQIHPFYPRLDEVGTSLNPGETLTTPPPPGEIDAEPPFGPECLVVIAVPATNPPVDFTALAQGGLSLSRATDPSQSLRSPLGELLESAMFRTGSRSGLSRSVADRCGMRILTWRTEPK